MQLCFISFSNQKNINMKFILNALFFLSFLALVSCKETVNDSITTLPQPDPDNRWGVFSGGDITRESHPLVKGIGIRMSWKEIEPSKGDFKFAEILGPQLENAHKNDFNTYLMIWVGPAKNFAPAMAL
jgi:hypothetical protein